MFSSNNSTQFGFKIYFHRNVQVLLHSLEIFPGCDLSSWLGRERERLRTKDKWPYGPLHRRITQLIFNHQGQSSRKHVLNMTFWDISWRAFARNQSFLHRRMAISQWALFFDPVPIHHADVTGRRRRQRSSNEGEKIIITPFKPSILLSLTKWLYVFLSILTIKTGIVS